MSTLCVSILCVSTLCVSTLCVRLHTTEKYENYHENPTSVLGPDVADNRKVRELPRKLDWSSWAGCCGTPKSTRITTKNRLQSLGRMLQRQKRQKSTSFIVKTPFKSIGEHRKVRELPRKMNIEEVEEAKKHENLQTKPVLDPFKSTAEHRKVRELPRKMKIEEAEEPETPKIYRQNPRAPAAATRKLREFTHETNMQARSHENSDEIRAPPVRYLDLATPAFYSYRKNPKCYHTFWGTNAFKNTTWLDMISKNETYLCCFDFFFKKNLIVHKKHHIQPCFDMQLFEVMPFFQRLQGVAFQPSSTPFSQRLAWVCLTFFFKGCF